MDRDVCYILVVTEDGQCTVECINNYELGEPEYERRMLKGKDGRTFPQRETKEEAIELLCSAVKPECIVPEYRSQAFDHTLFLKE